MTRSPKLTLTLLGGALLAAVVGLASAHAGDGYHEKGAHHGRAEHRIARLSEELNLSDDQAQQVRDAFERVREQYPRGKRMARDGQRPSQEERDERRAERRAKRAEMHQAVVGELSAILTPEQMVKFEQLHEDHQRRRQEMRGDRAGAL